MSDHVNSDAVWHFDAANDQDVMPLRYSLIISEDMYENDAISSTFELSSTDLIHYLGSHNLECDYILSLCSEIPSDPICNVPMHVTDVCLHLITLLLMCWAVEMWLYCGLRMIARWGYVMPQSEWGHSVTFRFFYTERTRGLQDCCASKHNGKHISVWQIDRANIEW